MHKQVVQIVDAAYGDSGRSVWAGNTNSVCSVRAGGTVSGRGVWPRDANSVCSVWVIIT